MEGDILHSLIVIFAIYMTSAENGFIQVVEAGSFKKAAEHLRMEPSSLSRRITALEARLQIKLLHRSTTRTRPTELGQAYYQGLKRITADQTALEESLISGVTTIRGVLRIGATVDMAEHFIVPVLEMMQQSASELSAELELGSDIAKLAEKNLDVAIRIGPLPDSALIAKPLGELPRIIVASPQYLDNRALPKQPSDLAEHNFIVYSIAQAKLGIQFSDGTVFPPVQLKSNVAVNSLRAIRRLVLDGVGMHWGPLWLYKEDLARGRLLRILPEYAVKGLSVNAVYSERDFLPQKTREFIRLMAEKIKESSHTV